MMLPDFLPGQGDTVIWRENETRTWPAIVISSKQGRKDGLLVVVCELHVCKGGHSQYVPDAPMGDVPGGFVRRDAARTSG